MLPILLETIINVQKIALACLLLALFSIEAKANSTPPFEIWEDTSLPDTVRIMALHQVIKSQYIFSDPDSAFYYAQLQYEFARKKGLHKHMALALNTQGVTFSISGDYNNAFKHHSKSLKIREQIRDSGGIASSLINLGNVFFEQKNYENAIPYYQKGLAASKAVDNDRGIAITLNNLGIIAKEQGNPEKAFEYFSESLLIKRSLNDKFGVANTLGNIGGIYALMWEPELAKGHFMRGLAIQEEIGDKRGMAGSLLNIGTIYFAQGDTAAKNGKSALSRELYTTSIDYGQRALAIAREVGAVIEIRDAALALYKTFQLFGKYEQALVMHELYIETRDSIENINQMRAVMQQEIANQYKKKETEDQIAFILQQEADKLVYQRRLFLLIGLFALLLWLVATYFRIRAIKRRTEVELLLKEIETIKAETTTKKAIGGGISSSARAEIDREKIEAAVDGTINQSDWKILNALFQNPGLSNREIANTVSLSIDGVRSSLRKLYRLFEIEKSSNQNQRIALILKASRISNTASARVSSNGVPV